MEVSTETVTATVIDELYEFSAPCFFDFTKGESEEEIRDAELWFETALSYAPSPFMIRIKAGNRTFQMESLCNFSEEEQMQKASGSSDATAPNSNLEDQPQVEQVPDKVKEEAKPPGAKVEIKQIVTKITNDNKEKENIGTVGAQENDSALAKKSHLNGLGDEEKSKSAVQVDTEACTPKPLMSSQRKLVSDKKHQTAKKIASTIRNSSMLKPKNGNAGTPNLAQENQAVKRQKLDGGRSRQILNVKPHNLPHKSKLGLTSDSSNLCSSTAKPSNKLDRKVYVREQAVPFVSMAEMMKKFQSCTRDSSRPHSSLNDNAAIVQMPVLRLTRPKEPEFETAQRMRPVAVKSTAELEEEMMAKIPKFKARPLNKKIFEASTLPSLPRSTPKTPEFQEFHFETMARASKNAETSSVASTEVSRQNTQWKPHLTEPKTPVLQTSLRARPIAVKSSIELEQEELEKAPKFKARPLNKKIFESKGELGIFCNTKKLVTIPQEFHFATHERIPPPAAVFDLFDKLSLKSESSHDPIPRNTIPNPFHLQTEERGAEKEKKFVMEIIEKQFEEERARVPKANPYPYTTDYPVIPSKPEPKQCTKLEPFQLESLVRIPPPAAVFDLFDKLSLKSESSHDPIPRNTIPNPFHLQTEERGAEKEKKFVMEIIEKQFEEERARVPKANPYPYTTDYPVIPSKPEPKQCTKLEPFQLESLVRHEEEMKREMEERQRKEKEEAQMRIFKAQPVLKEDPIPVSEKVRKPLTQVQAFDLHVNHRAVDRAEFDQKIKEKEMVYKRFREESEAARMIEEEKALKQLRRTMVPHARPLPKFDHPFCPQKSSKETTKPKSPHLRVLQRIERKKTISSFATPTSSPATLMR